VTVSPVVHLHTHSVYSLRQGLSTPQELVATARARGQGAIALTDVDGLYGMVPFVQAAREAGIKPLVGTELTLSIEGPAGPLPSRVTLLVREDQGFPNLSRLISQHHLTGRRGVPVHALAEHAAGLTLLTGGQHGLIPRLLATGQEERARQTLTTWREAFGAESCLIQLGPWWPASGLLAIAGSLELPTVVAHEAFYLRADQETTWKRLQAAHGLGHPAPGPRHLATEQELRQAWRHVPEALARTRTVADACRFEPVFGVPRLPAFPTTGGRSSEETLRALCEQGLATRYAGTACLDEARARMVRELEVIAQKGFADYFLIAWDLVRFARHQGISHLPRGSAAGSLVLHLLDISPICPLEHTLCFERFLNPDRRDLPDIDLDFDWRRRDEVVDYCFRTYGADHVARITTHQHHGPRGAVRLAGAVHGFDEEAIDTLASRMPRWSGGGDLKQAIAKSPECADLPLDQEPYKSLLKTAQAFEGLPDHLGIHACGIVISRDPLTDVVPLEQSAKGPVVTQFEMEGVEAVGLLKLDVLANRNLAILNDAVALVNERHGLGLVPETLPLDDLEAFKLLRTGRVLGIYQLESGGVQGLLRQFQPSHFEDVTAITSLYRPGPIEGGIKPRYIARRHGTEAVTYPDPCLKGILGHTYGLILYQEQCLQVMTTYAGLGMGQADELRKGIAKRNRREVERLKDPFLEGARRQGRDPRRAEEVWALLEKFAGYGFVKAHAASCAALTVREAYLKARWPVEYLACVLSTGVGYHEPRVYIEDVRSFGAAIALPCVNRSMATYTVEGASVLRIGLSGIKGIGPASVEAILSARMDGPFQDLGDLRRRTRLSRPELETLIRVGACECFGFTRPALMRQLAERGRTRSGPVQPTLFTLTEPAPAMPSTLIDYSVSERRQIELELFGFTVSVVPMPQEKGTIDFAAAKRQPRRSRVRVVADVVGRFSHRTRAGEKMAFLTLSDGVEQCQAVLFPRAYRELAWAARQGTAVFFGTLEVENGEPLLVVNGIEPLGDRRGVS